MSLDPRMEAALAAFVRKNVLPIGYTLCNPSRDSGFGVLVYEPWCVSCEQAHVTWDAWAATREAAIEAAWEHNDLQPAVTGPGLTIMAGRQVVGGGSSAPHGVVTRYERAVPPEGCSWMDPGVLHVRDGAILMSRSDAGHVVLKSFPFEAGDEVVVDPIILRYFLDQIDTAGK